MANWQWNEKGEKCWSNDENSANTKYDDKDDGLWSRSPSDQMCSRKSDGCAAPHLFDIHQSNHSPAIIWDQIRLLPLLKLGCWYRTCLVASFVQNWSIQIWMMKWTLLCCLISSTFIGLLSLCWWCPDNDRKSTKKNMLKQMASWGYWQTEVMGRKVK